MRESIVERTCSNSKKVQRKEGVGVAGMGGVFPFLLLFLALHTSPLFAQSQIKGTVIDEESGEPLQGANVFLDGTTIGAATDTLGLYKLSNLRPGPYTLVASMVGYETKKRDIIVQEEGSSSRRVDFELTPNPVELKGVTVEDSRDEWLDRLHRFRGHFFGDVPNANFCELLNPEVLSFTQSENGLVAYAEEPLRVRNEGLGYEVTYHVARYVASPASRSRYGNLEFDPLQPESPAQQQKWVRARNRAYFGSFRHFIDALKADALKSEGFVVGMTSLSPSARDRDRASSSSSTGIQRITESAGIFRSASSPGHAVLKIPRGKYIEVKYIREGEHQNFARRFRRGSPRSNQRSWVQIEGGSKVLIETRSGDFVRQRRPEFGRYNLNGYWGWIERIPVALPEDYRPPNAP